MRTKMSVFIVINNCIESKELYDELKRYKINVIDVGNKALVYATIDIRESDIEDIVKICGKYGECEIEAHLVDEKGS